MKTLKALITGAALILATSSVQATPFDLIVGGFKFVGTTFINTTGNHDNDLWSTGSRTHGVAGIDRIINIADDTDIFYDRTTGAQELNMVFDNWGTSGLGTVNMYFNTNGTLGTIDGFNADSADIMAGTLGLEAEGTFLAQTEVAGLFSGVGFLDITGLGGQFDTNGLFLGHDLSFNLSGTEVLGDYYGYTGSGDLVGNKVPEPSTLALLGLGAFGVIRRKVTG